jgi:eukaryotic-like serine/threonine-protein kinase
MKKEGFWSKDWFFALIIVVVVMLINFTTNFFGTLDTKAYDWGVSATSKTPSDRVAVIAIDEESIANLGRWPWSREIHANMIDKLTISKSKVIGHTAFFFEPQKDPGLVYINKLLEIYQKNNPVAPDGQAPIPVNPATAELALSCLRLSKRSILIVVLLPASRARVMSSYR